MGGEHIAEYSFRNVIQVRGRLQFQQLDMLSCSQYASFVVPHLSFSSFLSEGEEAEEEKAALLSSCKSGLSCAAVASALERRKLVHFLLFF